MGFVIQEALIGKINRLQYKDSTLVEKAKKWQREIEALSPKHSVLLKKKQEELEEDPEYTKVQDKGFFSWEDINSTIKKNSKRD